MQGLVKAIPNDDPSSPDTRGLDSSKEDKDGGSKEEGDTLEDLQLPSVCEPILGEGASKDASVLNVVEHLQAEKAQPVPFERLEESEEIMALPESTPPCEIASTIEHEESPSDLNLQHLEREGLSSPHESLAMVDRPKTRSRHRKSDEGEHGIDAIATPLPAIEAINVDVPAERRLSGVRRSLSSRDDAPEALVMDVDNTGPEGPKKKVRHMNSLGSTSAATSTRLKPKAVGKKKGVKQ